MVKALVIGDPHFKTHFPIEGQLFIDAISKLLQTIDPDFIVVLGDILDTHNVIHQSPFKQAIEFLDTLRKKAKTFVLIGNHDRPNNSDFLSDKHPFVSVKHWDNIVIVDNVVISNDFLFVPYVPPNRFMEAIQTKNVILSNIKAIFAHQEFKGAQMGAIKSEIEEGWDCDKPLVISGHIHDFQILENVIYIGTPYQQTFGDSGSKCICLFDFNDDITYEKIDLGLPKKIILHKTIDEIEDLIIDTSQQCKLVIHADYHEWETYKKNKRFIQKLKNIQERAKVVFELSRQKINKIQMNTNKQLSFKEQLFTVLKSNDLFDTWSLIDGAF